MAPAAGRPSLTVLAALDSARTQMYHLKAIAIAGMGFFTGAYDLFCISTVSRLLGRLYFQGEKYELQDRPSRQPMAVDDMVVGVALVGTLMGQLAFGYLGDRLGRKRIYGVTLVLMAVCALGSGMSFGSSRRAVVGTLCFFRFWLGVGVGGEHPLSATIMCEYANRKARGAFMAAVFAMQGGGIVFACLVSMPRALMATGGNGEDADVAIIAVSSSAATSKGKGVPRASAAAKGKGIARESTNGVVIAGRRVKLKGPVEYVWSHGERYKTNGFSCFYCTTAIAGGGATRFRQHLGGISGNVVACSKVPRFVKELIVDEVTKRNIRSKKNTDLKYFIQREVMAASRNYGTYGNTRIPPDEEAQIQMAMRESLREHALQHGSPPSIGKASGSGVGSCTANHQSKIDRFYKSPAAALDPKIIYTSKLAKSSKCKHAITLAFKKLARSSSKASAAIDQYILFRKQGKLFGGEEARRSALNGRVSAVDWWDQYGGDYPDLQYFAKRIVSQCMSSSGCERNWSTFALVHTKLRNRLSYDKLHKLVYVHYNLKLRIQLFEAEMQSLQDMQCHRESDSDPCSISMDCAMYDEDNPIMDWLCNSGKELGMDEAEVAAFKNRIFPKKSGKKRRLEFEEEEEKDTADDVESDSTQGSQPYVELGDSSSDDGGGDNGKPWSMVVSGVFLRCNPAPAWREDRQRSAQLPAADYVWRVVLMFAAFPALATLYWRMKLPETARYTALVSGDGKQAAMDMQAVLDVPMDGEQEKYPLLSREFARRHGRHLVGTATTWFLLQITFYSQNLTQKDVFQAIRLTSSPANMNALEEVFQILGTFPGYWVAVAIIDKIGRRLIQLVGFLMMSVFLLAMGLMPRNHNNVLFALLYAFTLFFASLGPNCTTFVLAAELFPARLRSTCHAISAAAGTAGAITTAYGVQNLNIRGYMSPGIDYPLLWRVHHVHNHLCSTLKVFKLLLPELFLFSHRLDLLRGAHKLFISIFKLFCQALHVI
ncbi:inorganic phosphate transporter 6 [Panicum miliaceum]|uniref:H(+)/Pi cotransporter n=1 Tax=Panicum miliaceum TaxID=4540 RepID=A0A3L6PM22_PANMI|nr:inorganic phosphate transporter 6 [Panicum miliaceum]